MKNVIIITIAALGIILTFAFVYACFAFVLADLNAFNWEQGERGGVVVFASFLSLFWVGFVLEKTKF